MNKMSHLTFQKVPESLESRIQIAKNNKEELEPNCYGTAFFLLGVLPYDMVIFTNARNLNVRNALNRMEELACPKDNSIIVLSDDREICHVAFIEQANPLKGYHRLGPRCEVREIFQLSDIENYGSVTYRHRFYSVKESDNLLDWAKDIVEEYHPFWWG